MQLVYCCWHPAWGLKAAVLEEDLSLWLYPDSEGLGPHPPQPAGEGLCLCAEPLRTVDRCPAYCMNDALSRKHSLFCASPLPLRVFWNVCHFLILTLWRWKVACPACEGREAAVILLGQRPWAFSQKNLLRNIFPLVFFPLFLHRRKCNEWGDCLVFSIHRRFDMN